jgi:phosphohistidine phosphatase
VGLAGGRDAMRHLMLLRHAKTEKDSPTGNDRERRLNSKGRADAPALGRYLATHGLAPQLVLVSPAARALETWELVVRELPRAPRHLIVHGLYGAGPSQLLEIARAVPIADAEADRLMIVAHNPGLHEFARALINGARSKPANGSLLRALSENLPTTGLAIVGVEITTWSDLSFGDGRLEALVSPALLRGESEES